MYHGMNKVQLALLDTEQLIFPHPKNALQDPEGLLAVGGDLRPERLLLAYKYGIFPWYSENEPILWWSPNPRAILWIDQVNISKSMKKFIRKTDYIVTLNKNFAGVIQACAQQRQDETWITQDIQDAYIKLHQLGFAHSVEVWHNECLIGGLYGVEQGQVFCGESMFSSETNASKLALITFCQYFATRGGRLIDCQVLNDHTKSMGAIEISRDQYLKYLQQLQQQPLKLNCWDSRQLDIHDKTNI
ncbi:leucyl/phenylalanyl-tRNA--protein transferase [Zophobihabitans entericus]|uniref:Leucyl/phenylalanyl-tRNA--protein transferase n=2 Tax=Zophobihabitans entericus TaxID=1635327 RepID=A0A6G9IF07_9GAMM|nr:leucyl/phenylalanyl-tRNA--protein transferase [Zophobihabitans entericus]